MTGSRRISLELNLLLKKSVPLFLYLQTIASFGLLATHIKSKKLNPAYSWITAKTNLTFFFGTPQ